jgi:protein SCO1/2
MSTDSTPSSAAPTENPAPKRIPRLGWVIVFVVLVGLVAFAYVSLQKMRPVASALPRLEQAPSFSLTSQDGKTVTEAVLKGKVTVLNFIFTRCMGPCPRMSAQMGHLNQALGPKLEDVQLISVSVDPEHDTPAVLAEYGQRFGAEPGRWKLLTGPTDQIHNVMVKGFLLPLGTDKDGMPAHSTRFVIVDQQGVIRGYEDGESPEVVQKLLMDIGDLLREGKSGSR